MKRILTFLSALLLFLTGISIAAKNNKETEEEVVAVITPSESLTNITKIIIENTTPIIIETLPTEETKSNLLTLDEIALEVIGNKWGSGEKRKESLIAAGYDYNEVSRRVNEILNGEPYEIPNRNTYKMNFAYVPKKVEVYDEFGNVEGTLSQYQKVLLTDKKINGMILVHFKDQTFYLKETDIKLLADSHLEIDISDQKVYVYIDGILILDADIITGYPGKGTTPGTNLGITEVYSKSYNVTFTEEKKSEYFILFNWDGEGFHDASWRADWEFNDKSRYLTHGSDGCANMKYEDVTVIEENSYLGMPVLTHK